METTRLRCKAALVPELNYEILSVVSVPFAAVPLLAFQLEVVSQDQSARVHSGILRCQIQIDATQRRYDTREQARLLDLFGEPERWSTTLKRLLWTHVTVAIPPFTSRTILDVAVPCSFDFNIAATKYFDGLTSGDLPLIFQFSGTVFYESNADHTLQVAPISWEKEAKFRVPVRVWRDLMDHYYPNSAWLRLSRDSFDRLADYKRQHAIPTWEAALDRIWSEGRPVVGS